ncbi:hydrogen peroxide-inducible genes activator [Chitinophagaceae bacterium 26-R-25]|nr:hydrogen peroxide-inducible genes activator [Chitinophagaceae bacterium 26-R-25]
MTFTQLEYIVAVDNFRHFAAAADACFVTQPTLSMQVQKLEADLGVKIFDRSKQPVVPTEAGIDILAQARKIIAEKNVIQEIVQQKKGILTGELRIGIIPTLAPYLLPLFVKGFSKKFPQIKLVVNEMMTDVIIARLKEGRIDVGILVTPLHENGIKEYPLFYEELLAYVSRKNDLFKKTVIQPTDIAVDKLWLMEEGHCFRSQIVNLCDLRKRSEQEHSFKYEAGSLETLRRMVEVNEGITILPELATTDMAPKQLQLIRHFRNPSPMREVSLVVHRDFVKKRLIDTLKSEIISAVPEKIKKNKKSFVVEVNEE